MAKNEALELSKWMSEVADEYSKSILTVIDLFNKFFNKSYNIELSKINVEKMLSKGGSKCVEEVENQ